VALDEQRERRQHDHPGIVQATAVARSGLAAEVRAKTALLAGPPGAAHELPDGGVHVTADGRVHVVEIARAISA
jgi:hypothetical protein